jgi:hypothetical protein
MLRILSFVLSFIIIVNITAILFIAFYAWRKEDKDDNNN